MRYRTLYKIILKLIVIDSVYLVHAVILIKVKLIGITKYIN